MRRLVCPSCKSIVLVAPGVTPSCASCGYGTTQGRTRAPAATAPAAKRGKGLAITLACVAAVLVLAGAAFAAYLLMGKDDAPTERVAASSEPSKAPQLTEAQAAQRLAAGFRTGSSALQGKATDADLRKVTMTGSIDDAEGLGPGTMNASLEFGLADAMRATVQVEVGGFSMKFSLTCVDGRAYLTRGTQTVASRPSAVPDEACLEEMGMDQSDLNETFPMSEAQAAGATITIRPDGWFEASLTENGTVVTAVVDDAGRLREVTANGKEGNFTATFEYGARVAIAAPTTFDLIPADVTVDEDYEAMFEDDGFHATVTESPHIPPLADLEVRVVEFGDFGGEEPLETLPLVAGTRKVGAYTITVTDVDADGRLTVGDKIDVVPDEPATDDEWMSGHHYVLYDAKADGAVGEGMMAPAPAILGVLAALGVALVARRRSA